MTTVVLEHLQHANSGSPDLTVGPDGNIGIGGVAAPSANLEIKPTGADGELKITSDANGGNNMRLIQGYNSYINASNNVYISAGGNTSMFNLVNGNVGIRTSSPSFGAGGFGLEVKGTGRPTVRVTEETSTHAVQLSATDGAAILESRSANMDLVFGTSGVEKMRIDDTNGYVHMNSASQIRLTLGNEGTPGTNTANWIRGNAGYLQYNAANNAHTWEVGGTERMRLHPGGQLVTPQIPAVVALCTGGFSTSYDAGTSPWYDINPWTTTAYNNGGHFSTGTGLFTAPVAGYYHVCIALEAVATSNSYGVYILKNGSSYSAYVNGRIIGGNIRATPNLSATVDLAQNDTIGVRVYMSGSSSLSWDNNGYMSIHLVG